MQAILDIVPIGIGVAVIPECRLITYAHARGVIHPSNIMVRN